MTTKQAIKKLEAMTKDYELTDLQRAVAESIIDHLDGYDTPEQFFNDLLEHGCISGMIGELIYYKDTYAFFDKHYSDILNILEEIQDETGEPFHIMKDGDIKNTGAWLAYEETARQIANELGLEV